MKALTLVFLMAASAAFAQPETQTPCVVYNVDKQLGQGESRTSRYVYYAKKVLPNGKIIFYRFTSETWNLGDEQIKAKIAEFERSRGASIPGEPQVAFAPQNSNDMAYDPSRAAQEFSTENGSAISRLDQFRESTIDTCKRGSIRSAMGSSGQGQTRQLTEAPDNSQGAR